MRQLLAEKD